ncbi:MAG: tRNA (adenosine(37)-N6)-dimethylallyltransferase MiaA [Armatimonadetes bacterium]|nr:tRNA (adenosine(37)-N6)-dimethylallyltransferase MiaA [Armatimonadota bacterium]
MSPFLLAVMGPTGSGKSPVAEVLAEKTDALLLNADAFQVYRGLDIGTNKPNDRSRYRLIDVVGPTEGFGLGQWVRLALRILEDAYQEGRNVIVVGGTGLYVRALFEEYADMSAAPDPDLRSRLVRREQEEGLEALVEDLRRSGRAEGVDLANPVRVRRALERSLSSEEPIHVRLPGFRKKKVALEPPVPGFETALSERVGRMWDAGWPEEVEGLLASGVPETAPSFRAIGYQSVARFLRGRSTRQETVATIAQQTRRYAKRQRTWLRTEPLLTAIGTEGFDDRAVGRAVLDVLQLL